MIAARAAAAAMLTSCTLPYRPEVHSILAESPLPRRLDDKRGLPEGLLDLEDALLWLDPSSGALIAVRKLDDESSRLGLAKDGSNTGLGILNMLGDCITDIMTGDETRPLEANVVEASRGDIDVRFVAKWLTDTLLWSGEFTAYCVLAWMERISSPYSKENFRAWSRRSDSGRVLGVRDTRRLILRDSSDGVCKPEKCAGPGSSSMLPFSLSKVSLRLK